MTSDNMKNTESDGKPVSTTATVDVFGEIVEVTGKVMPNGEVRRRLKLPEGTSFNHTVAGNEGGWQNAHFHKGLFETQVVISGKMAVATEIENGTASHKVHIYVPGDVYTSVKGEAHNVYLYPLSVIATVTHGEPIGNPENKGNDWYAASTEFDRWSKGLTESDISRLTR